MIYFFFYSFILEATQLYGSETIPDKPTEKVFFSSRIHVTSFRCVIYIYDFDSAIVEVGWVLLLDTCVPL